MLTKMSQPKVIRRSARWVGVLLIAALLAGLLPLGVFAAPQSEDECKQPYQVKRGDTLSKISSKFGMEVKQIVYFNEWSKPYTIYVGQNICIPTKSQSNVPKVDNKYANAPAAYFVAGRVSDSVVVYTYNYPKTTVLVKVDNAGDSKKKFLPLGKINIASSGNNKSWKFNLPAELKNASKLQVCLKDFTTSYLQCVYPRSGS